MSILDLQGLSKTFADGDNTIHALRDIDLRVAAGELVAVMGPSGSGKSTLLTIAGGLEAPTSGQVLVTGRDLAELNPDERAGIRRRTIGYVFQDLNLINALTAAENVSLPLELDGMKAKPARTEACTMLERVGLADKVHRFPDDLSGGERQRVAIARALIGDHRLILADEPTGALDSVNGEDIMRLIRRACDDGAAGVIVTHDAQLAAWADRILFLRDERAIDHAVSSSSTDLLLEAASGSGTSGGQGL